MSVSRNQLNAGQATASVSKVGYPEISKIRAELRKESYLLHPEEEKEHASLNNVILSHELVNFSLSANAIKADHLQSFIQNARIGNFVSGNSSPEKRFICVTQEEEEKSSAVENMNKEALCRNSYEMMESFREFERNLLRKFSEKMLKTKQNMYM